MENNKVTAKKASDQVTIEELSAQIEKLKSDMSELTGSASRYARQRGEHVAEEARTQARAAIHRGEEQFDSLQRALADLPDEAMASARRHPGTALGLAVGLGFLFGMMTARK